MQSVNKYKCEHGKQCKSRCSQCLGHPVNQGKCSRCKTPFDPKNCEERYYNGRLLQTCMSCKYDKKCEHGMLTSKCRNCINQRTSQYRRENKCIHQKRKDACKLCDPQQYLIKNMRSRLNRVLKQNKIYKTIQYLGCDIEQLKEHIEAQFKDGMTWQKMGTEIHIDHKIPIMYDNPTLEQVIQRLHYTNLQPMWAHENMSKGNRFISE